MRIAINGMGRIGRLLFRRLVGDPNIELVAINDIMEPDNLAYLLKYDSVYGTFPYNITLQEDDKVAVNGQSIAVLQEPDPIKLPWKALAIDVVLECSGRFTSKAGASAHLAVGAKKYCCLPLAHQKFP
ncbi:glyceraldehyde 3-phosphate dehydrogenase NAD-binding domain-containing protein [Paraflavitalea speifideaquila]|uniref:glyceraldehyde 3-phosphate dehydrogenase NAD-binding domain-containing protein n=1 Tax=Paraflavitalea speifideaquila TaxID=3076558 RepID=UPI0028E72A5E|nr:glyceraldehyde 3-phosphate dehydrogenase NAD-binding domain-containing protein [Paraflavitalea speifideiaquila]